MATFQFRILYREFLFRLVDLELLSPDAQGDTSKLLGRFAGLLAFFSMYLGAIGLIVGRKHMSALAFQILSWRMEHFFISTTMLIVGLFAVLSWDSIFPDRRDILVLGPLPIRTRTLFLSKVAAAGSGLGLAICIFNAAPGLTWPTALECSDPSFFDMALPFAHVSFFAYWVTMVAAGTFLFCCVLGIQGLAALLPRHLFFRFSSFLQLSAFCVFTATYFLEPSLVTPASLAAPQNQRLLAWLPDYWFLGVFQQLNGTLTPETAYLAHRAWAGFAVAVAITAVAYAICYFHILRRMVEEPDILPAAGRWSPNFGSGTWGAIVQFSVRALARSRQHRIVLAFYLGTGLAFLLLFWRPASRSSPHLPPTSLQPIVCDIIILMFCVLGIRMIFTIPLDLRANWVFRLTPIRGGSLPLSAARFSLYLLAWLPVWTSSAAWFLSNWPWRMALAHLAVFGLMGAFLVEVSLYNFQKIPFTCSWLPGKSNILFAFLGFALLFQTLLINGAAFELKALSDPALYAKMSGALFAAVAAARWCATRRVSADESVVQFEEEESPLLQGLGLFRDGVLPSSAGKQA